MGVLCAYIIRYVHRESHLLTRTYLPASMEVKDNNTAARIRDGGRKGRQRYGRNGTCVTVHCQPQYIIIIIHNT